MGKVGDWSHHEKRRYPSCQEQRQPFIRRGPPKEKDGHTYARRKGSKSRPAKAEWMDGKQTMCCVLCIDGYVHTLPSSSSTFLYCTKLTLFITRYALSRKLSLRIYGVLMIYPKYLCVLCKDLTSSWRLFTALRSSLFIPWTGPSGGRYLHYTTRSFLVMDAG